MKKPKMNKPKTIFVGHIPATITAGSMSELLKIHTAEVNQESPHLTVPFYMPLALPMSFEDALRCTSSRLQEQTRIGAISLVAVAHGQMAFPDKGPSQVQFVLFFDTDKDAPGYYIFDTASKEVEAAVLMHGDGTLYLEPRPLPSTEAVAFWMGGFLRWSEKIPGLYQLRYAMIDQPSSD